MIREIFEHNKGRYGVRRVHHELINRGYKVNHKKVQRLMHCMDLKDKRRKKNTILIRERSWKGGR
ncbi:transposase [Clostridiales bacterium]|nr:transposase [Clostridiales bacterium]